MTTDSLPPNTETSPNNEQISKNAFSDVSAMTDPSNTDDRRVAHVETIKVGNNCFPPPVQSTILFGMIVFDKEVELSNRSDNI